MRSFCRKTCVHKIARFRGGGILGFGGGGGSANFIFMGVRIFLKRAMGRITKILVSVAIALAEACCERTFHIAPRLRRRAWVIAIRGILVLIVNPA